MNQTVGVIRYGSECIRFQIIERPLRQTLGIEVYPDGSVVALVPKDCDELTLYSRLQQRAGWISRQLSRFAQFERTSSPRQYLSGESYRYLGRQYRLCVRADISKQSRIVTKLQGGKLVVSGPGALSRERVKRALTRWYSGRAREVYGAVLESKFNRFRRMGHERPQVTVREMQRRWGSLSPSGRMTLNSRLIQAPRQCIEYVIVHELCHLEHPNHGPGFHALLELLMPDWQERKRRLECIDLF